MNTTHPDIKLGQPIPMVEPRINRDMLEATRDTILAARWFFGSMLLLGVVSRVVHPGMFTTLGIFLGLTVLFVSIILIQRMRKRRSDPTRKKWSELKQDKWSIPFRYTLETIILSASMGFMYPFLMPNDSRFLIGMLGLMGFCIGVVLLVFSRTARQPGQICCEECEYPLHGLTLPCLCPECGYSLLTPAYTTDRPHVRSPKLVWSGATAVIFGLSIALTGFLRPGVYYAPMPRSALLALAPSDAHAFKQLIKTPLTDAETSGLINSIINAHLSAGQWSASSAYEQEQWLGAHLAAGTISAEQLARLMSTLKPIEIKASTTARVGEPIALTLTTKRTRMPSTAFSTNYYFAGFIIADDPTPHGQTEKMLWPMYIRSDGGVVARKSDDTPEYTFTPTQAGTITVHARILRVLLDPNRGFQPRWMAWNDDGQPEILIPFAWSRIDDIELTITVEP